MDDQTKHKTPQELGEAVGRKIEELFGGLFSDEAEPKAEAPLSPPEKAAPPAKPVPRPAPQPAPSRGSAGQPVTTARPSAPDTGRDDLGKRTSAFEELVEHIEALILNMDWEVNPESATELTARFKEIEPLLPPSGPARNILAMNDRVLARCNTPEASPHPSLNKFLQQSVTGLKSIYASQGRQPLGQDLVAGLTQGYKEIMASSVVVKTVPEAGPLAAGKEAAREYGKIVNELGNSIRSLGEVSQRLGRILGAFRQGGEMSTDEISRRLGTLEGLLSDRMEKLSSFHKALMRVAPPVADGRSPDGPSASKTEGILMVVWEGTPLAIPASAVTVLFPLSKAQAEQFVGKSTLMLASKPVQRLPLKKPAGSEQRGRTLASWLVRLAWGGKDFFLLADKSLGYRQTPEGVDLSREKQIKIGGTSLAVLNLAAFR